MPQIQNPLSILSHLRWPPTNPRISSNEALPKVQDNTTSTQPSIFGDLYLSSTDPSYVSSSLGFSLFQNGPPSFDANRTNDKRNPSTASRSTLLNVTYDVQNLILYLLVSPYCIIDCYGKASKPPRPESGACSDLLNVALACRQLHDEAKLILYTKKHFSS